MRMTSLFKIFVGLCVSTAAIAADARAAGEHTYQKYWDGKVAPPLRWSNACKDSAETFAANNPAYASPPLMALGDSLYNGVQSLRMNWWLSEWSAPSLVAMRLGYIKEKGADRTGARDFYGPQYPGQGGHPDETINYGFDLEKRVRKGEKIKNLSSIPKEQSHALRGLLDYRPPNGRAMVDNLAFSGANSLDLVYWTAGEHRALAEVALKKLSSWIIFTAFSALGDAFTYANAAFVLNPMNDPCLADMTPLEQVELRRPKRLLINIGSNNGLYKIALEGHSLTHENCKASELKTGVGKQPHCVSGIETFLGKQLPEDMEEIFNRLAAIKNLEYVYVNNLALPSQVANVTKPGNSIRAKPRFTLDLLGKKVVSRQIIDDGDKLVTKVNALLKAKIDERNTRPGPRFVYVDVAEKMGRYDFKKCQYLNEGECETKHGLEIKGTGLPGRYFIDNRPLRMTGANIPAEKKAFFSNLKQGGLFSFDNMHLSSAGYEIMAMSVREAMENAKDKALFPLQRPGGHCSEGSNDPKKHLMQEGDCIMTLTNPGWSMADYTRREFVFQRIAGQDEMDNRDFISAVLGFVN